MASGKSEIFEFVLQFLPDWIQMPALGLFVLVVLVSWGIKLRRERILRRAVRGAVAAHGELRQQGDGTRGADFLGSYAPQNQPERR
ncbi:hypothetical protein IAG44_33125 [Streptomyces roseirectus]|uniref:Uncharacterized protein n=1 Tax=Streptomyces roseirectus TaxID=2768066 RepID=A0A7H0IM14_9ACTN|nr:hypothetical protein [Streptomyces roseirectus]QNP73830.1 hypothetical protein IAG44_33125 [Streptomyces roseirectus]